MHRGDDQIVTAELSPAALSIRTTSRSRETSYEAVKDVSAIPPVVAVSGCMTEQARSW